MPKFRVAVDRWFVRTDLFEVEARSSAEAEDALDDKLADQSVQLEPVERGTLEADQKHRSKAVWGSAVELDVKEG